jgi:hypothetical protein
MTVSTTASGMSCRVRRSSAWTCLGPPARVVCPDAVDRLADRVARLGCPFPWSPATTQAAVDAPAGAVVVDHEGLR